MGDIRFGFGVLALGLLLGCGDGSTQPGTSPDPGTDTKNGPKRSFPKDMKVIDTAIGEEITEGGLKLRVEAVKIGTIKVQSKPDEGFVERPNAYLLIELSLTNVGEQRKLPYIPWGSHAATFGSAARLTAGSRSMKLVTFGPDAAVEGQLRSGNLIQGKPRRDLLVFDLPPRDAKLLQLELPRDNYGDYGQEPIRLRLGLKW